MLCLKHFNWALNKAPAEGGRVQWPYWSISVMGKKRAREVESHGPSAGRLTQSRAVKALSTKIVSWRVPAHSNCSRFTLKSPAICLRISCRIPTRLEFADKTWLNQPGSANVNGHFEGLGIKKCNIYLKSQRANVSHSRAPSDNTSVSKKGISLFLQKEM